MYKKVNNLIENKETEVILRTTDNAYIPFDPANTDYQEFLAWKSKGNQAEEAE